MEHQHFTQMQFIEEQCLPSTSIMRAFHRILDVLKSFENGINKNTDRTSVRDLSIIQFYRPQADAFVETPRVVPEKTKSMLSLLSNALHLRDQRSTSCRATTLFNSLDRRWKTLPMYASSRSWNFHTCRSPRSCRSKSEQGLCL